MMTPVWRMLQMPDIHHPSPSPDRQGSVCVWSCSHVLCLCLASWGSCQPIRGQEGDSLTNQRTGQCWPWHGCCDEGRGGDSVPVSGMEYKIQILHWIVHRRDADSGQLSDEENCVERMQRVDPTCQHREKHPIEREIYSACSRLFLRGYTHPTLIGITFCTFRTFCEIGSQWECLSSHYNKDSRDLKNYKISDRSRIDGR